MMDDKAKGMKDYNDYIPKTSQAPKNRLRRALPVGIALLLLIVFYISPFGTRGSWERRQTHFPRKIWQTWKVDPFEFEEANTEVARTWVSKNPSYRYEVLTDQNDISYVQYNFGPTRFNRPDIVWVYSTLQDRIIKADLLRYLVMWVEGGLYTDIDVEALRPIDSFIPTRYSESDVEMIVGVEVDQPDFEFHPLLSTKCMSFVQWTFVCKPQLPVMMALVEFIMAWLDEVAVQQNVPISEIKLDFDQVISGTGPTAFTNAILADMSRREKRDVVWDEFHDLTESKLLGGVLVLTVEAFAAGQGHSDSGNHDSKHALVKHHYHASKWPDSHPRYNHPVYGEVEACNWDHECVDQWDRDKAEFDKLNPEEQAAAVAEAEERRRREEEDERMREELAALAGPGDHPNNPIFESQQQG